MSPFNLQWLVLMIIYVTNIIMQYNLVLSRWKLQSNSKCCWGEARHIAYLLIMTYITPMIRTSIHFLVLLHRFISSMLNSKPNRNLIPYTCWKLGYTDIISILLIGSKCRSITNIILKNTCIFVKLSTRVHVFSGHWGCDNNFNNSLSPLFLEKTTS